MPLLPVVQCHGTADVLFVRAAVPQNSMVGSEVFAPCSEIGKIGGKKYFFLHFFALCPTFVRLFSPLSDATGTNFPGTRKFHFSDGERQRPPNHRSAFRTFGHNGSRADCKPPAYSPLLPCAPDRGYRTPPTARQHSLSRPRRISSPHSALHNGSAAEFRTPQPRHESRHRSGNRPTADNGNCPPPVWRSPLVTGELHDRPLGQPWRTPRLRGQASTARHDLRPVSEVSRIRTPTESYKVIKN